MRIGVLALQGAFAEHIAVLQQLDVQAPAIRLPRQLAGVDALVIPGGESTTMTGLMLSYNLRTEIGRLAGDGLPILGTCAGMIMLARDVEDERVQPVAAMGIRARRNAFGGQRESFEANLSIPVLGEEPFPGVFIRAPTIEDVDSSVEVLARLERAGNPHGGSGPSDGAIVAAREGRLLVCAFHPELTDDLRFHLYFIRMVRGEA